LDTWLEEKVRPPPVPEGQKKIPDLEDKRGQLQWVSLTIHFLKDCLSNKKQSIPEDRLF